MRPKIILHVGCEKTGSTSIQKVLWASYKGLVNSGILFPKSIGQPTHIQLTACVLDEYPDHPIRSVLRLGDQTKYRAFTDSVKDRLGREVASVKPRKIIISDEHVNVHLSNRELLSRYRALCEEFGDIESVVIYLRRQDELRLSMFSEAVKNGAMTNVDLKNPLPTLKPIPYRFNYLKILDNLSEVFGRDKLVPRIYDRNAFVNRDVVSDFMRVIGIDDPPISLMAISEDNRSIDASVLIRLGDISRFLKKFDSRWTAWLRKRSIKICERVFAGPGAMLADEVHERFMSQFADMNAAIKKKYFGDMDQMRSLFPERGPHHRPDAEFYPACTLSWGQFLTRLLKGIVLRI